ncbi:ribosomal L18ae/LX protein domain-containing protein [Colletotrichum cereale]|nr:ribosomal L18ae/LX protein domain-containing protein [Colletotrichum cereale]
MIGPGPSPGNRSFLSHRILFASAAPKSSKFFDRATTTISDNRRPSASSSHLSDGLCSGRLTEYEVIGRHLPTESNPTPALYRMTIFAPNVTVAKSRYWYFLRGLKKVKKATGEIVSVKEIHEKHPLKVKNFGVWLRYDSRSGTHNMYKEYREMSRTDAVEALYSDMAARHRARFRSIHILKVVELEKGDDVKRPYIKQLLTKDLSFPLPHRVAKLNNQKIFSAKRPTTFA